MAMFPPFCHEKGAGAAEKVGKLPPGGVPRTARSRADERTSGRRRGQSSDANILPCCEFGCVFTVNMFSSQPFLWK